MSKIVNSVKTENKLVVFKELGEGIVRSADRYGDFFFWVIKTF